MNNQEIKSAIDSTGKIYVRNAGIASNKRKKHSTLQSKYKKKHKTFDRYLILFFAVINKNVDMTKLSR